MFLIPTLILVSSIPLSKMILKYLKYPIEGAMKRLQFLDVESIESGTPLLRFSTKQLANSLLVVMRAQELLLAELIFC